MSEPIKEPFTDLAEGGVIGLAPRSDTEPGWWPTEGYDGRLNHRRWETEDALARSGASREQWLALADEMIRRWTEWRAYIEAL